MGLRTTSSLICRRLDLLARVLLIGQMIAVATWMGSAGRLHPVRVNDSASYIEYPFGSLKEAFNSTRTPGFSAFLKVAAMFDAEWRAVPILVSLVFAAATMAFFEALRLSTGSLLAAFSAASSLLYANILHGYVQTVATDSLAAALGIASCSALLVWMRSPGGWSLFCVGVAVATGWLVRPGSLFLCPLIPVVAGILRGLIPPDVKYGLLRSVVILSLTTCLPPVAYATLRSSVTGHWGIVAFGGFNAIGIAGQFITPELVDQLPESFQPIARGALERRARRPQSSEHLDFEPRLHYLRMERHYDLTIWDEFAPAAAEVLGDNTAQINAALGELAQETIRLRPGEYALWLAKATRQAVKKLLWDIADNPVDLGVLLATVAMTLIRIGLMNRSTCNQVADTKTSPRAAVWVIDALSVSYAAMNLVLVCLVCPPLGRMTDAAGVLLPAALFTRLGRHLASLLAPAGPGVQASGAPDCT